MPKQEVYFCDSAPCARVVKEVHHAKLYLAIVLDSGESITIEQQTCGTPHLKRLLRRLIKDNFRTDEGEPQGSREP